MASEFTKAFLRSKSRFLKKNLRTLPNYIISWNTYPETSRTHPDHSGTILKLLEAFWENSIFWIFKKNFTLFSHCFGLFLTLFVNCGCKESIFSKSKMNIKNLAREVLDISPYFPRLQWIDHRTRFQREVNFRVDIKIRFFTLKLASQPKKAFLRSKSRFLKIFCVHYQIAIYHQPRALGPKEYPQTTQGPFRSFWKDFEQIQFFEFSKIFAHFLTVLFWPIFDALRT